MSRSTKTTSAEIDLRSLRPGDTVDVHQLDGRWTYHGEIDTVDCSHKVLWILHGALRERKLLAASEHQIRSCSCAAPAAPVVSPPMDPPARYDPGRRP
jgi:hypothetical protein